MDSLFIRKNDYPWQPETANRNGNRQEELLKGILFLGILSIILISAYHLITHCSYFRIKDIAVIGNERVSRDEALLYAGIREGINIADLNLYVAQKRLLANPWVAEARMDAVFPSGIRIHIAEHQPLAVFDMGRRFIINQKGNIFKEVEPHDFLEVPTVRGLKFTDITNPDAGESFKAVMDVLHCGQQQESIIPNTLIREIRAERETGLTLVTADNFHPVPVKKICLGFSDYPLKYIRLRKLFAYLKENSGMQKIESIDLNNPDRIVVNPGRTESPAGENKEV
ncbi:MAG: cell division protein FtsQ/DivIB [Desulfococcaceae bacterium]